ncbi:substrate-binding periplasmic protein [Dongshaea marina]|uniref:substrate-binding periplasmic protein n=1 Tax=Dongshaea marina TaxID=2047966 RepID=UPI00131F2CDF|nr:transporter substrate-binding domain-containing protein [Dongshaea marina]
MVTDNWRPYNYEENGEIKGIGTEILKKILNRSGFKYEITVYPWPRAYRKALHEKNVLIYSISRTPDREHLFKWVVPVGKSQFSYLYRLKKNSHINPKNIQEAKTYKVGANLNSMNHLWLISEGFSIDMLTTPHSQKLTVKMFAHGRFDMIAFNSATMKDEFSHYGLSPDKVTPVLALFKTAPYIAMSQRTDDLVKERLLKAYDALVQEGELERIEF